ncbi:hypothetical protein IIA15_11200 [candidate division TA06 bacterium]|nr:hypothetical protein [candidate division TA06 bacterium]
MFKNTHSIPNESKIFILILFASAPAFLYEVAVRSELVSNMILVLGMIFLYDKWRHPSRGLERRLGAFLIGLSLSTRAIALLPFTIYLAHLWRNREERNQLLVDVLFAVFAFLLTILPILLWNVSSFLEAGPLSLQNSYLPLSVVIALMIASILMGWRARNLLQVLSGSAILLFVVGVAYIAIQIPSLLDLPEQIRSSQVDISYLIFSLPFLLIIFGRMLHLNNAPEVQTISSPSTGKENE